jgi:hypothetical protein
MYDVLRYVKSASGFSSDYPMNLTATQSPQVDKARNLVALFIDGLFYDTRLETSHVNPTKINQVTPPHYPNSHKE